MKFHLTWLTTCLLASICSVGTAQVPLIYDNFELQDNQVDVLDLLRLIALWETDSPDADINYDGTVDIADLLLLIGAWGDCP